MGSNREQVQYCYRNMKEITFLKGNKNDFDGSNNIFTNCKVYIKQELGSVIFYPGYSDYLDTDSKIL